MKKENGFTLIELMAVITILVLLSLIIIPIIDKNIKKTKQNMYIIQIENIRMAGISYFSDNPNYKPTDGNNSSVTLDTLEQNGYIEKDVKNPLTNQTFDNTIYVQIKNNNNRFDYKVCPLENCTE